MRSFETNDERTLYRMLEAEEAEVSERDEFLYAELLMAEAGER